MMVLPLVPETAERPVLKDLIGTFGKTIHLWQVDINNQLPIGPPQLMMAFTKDGQINSKSVGELVNYGVHMSKNREARADIEAPIKNKFADQWEKTGKTTVFEPKEEKMKGYYTSS